VPQTEFKTSSRYYKGRVRHSASSLNDSCDSEEHFDSNDGSKEENSKNSSNSSDNQEHGKHMEICTKSESREEKLSDQKKTTNYSAQTPVVRSVDRHLISSRLNLGEQIKPAATTAAPSAAKQPFQLAGSVMRRPLALLPRSTSSNKYATTPSLSGPSSTFENGGPIKSSDPSPNLPTTSSLVVTATTTSSDLPSSIETWWRTSGIGKLQSGKPMSNQTICNELNILEVCNLCHIRTAPLTPIYPQVLFPPVRRPVVYYPIGTIINCLDVKEYTPTFGQIPSSEVCASPTGHLISTKNRYFVVVGVFSESNILATVQITSHGGRGIVG
jgi:hypothetical protein